MSTARIAEVLAEHRFVPDRSQDGTLNYGWCAGGDSYGTKHISDHEAHVAAAVAAALDDLPAAESAALSEDERRSLGCQCWRLDDVWQHGRGCPVPAVEAIIARRSAPTAQPSCTCTPYTIRTDYGTGVEHDLEVDENCPIHGAPTAQPEQAAETVERVLRGVRFRVEVACMGYAALTEDDVPDHYIGTELDAYREGAAAAAEAIRAALAQPAPTADQGARGE